VRVHGKLSTLLILVALVALPALASQHGQSLATAPYDKASVEVSFEANDVALVESRPSSGPGRLPNEPMLAEPYEEAPIETSLDANDAEVRFYGNKHGVGIDRAIDIANWLEDAAPFLTALPELTDIYADARLLHGRSAAAPDLPLGEIQVEIKVTDPSDPDLRGLVESIAALRVGEFAAQVAVYRVPRSLAELNILASEQMTGLEPGSVEIVYDFDRGEVILRPAPPLDSDSMWPVRLFRLEPQLPPFASATAY
jgi:hypothetical protein